jgi:hypothetical protein
VVSATEQNEQEGFPLFSVAFLQIESGENEEEGAYSKFYSTEVVRYIYFQYHVKPSLLLSLSHFLSLTHTHTLTSLLPTLFPISPSDSLYLLCLIFLPLCTLSSIHLSQYLFPCSPEILHFF